MQVRARDRDRVKPELGLGFRLALGFGFGLGLKIMVVVMIRAGLSNRKGRSDKDLPATCAQDAHTSVACEQAQPTRCFEPLAAVLCTKRGKREVAFAPHRQASTASTGKLPTHHHVGEGGGGEQSLPLPAKARHPPPYQRKFSLSLPPLPLAAEGRSPA